MKIQLFRLCLILTAILGTAYTKISHSNQSPYCPSGTALFYFIPPSSTVLLYDIFNPANYQRLSPSNRNSECYGTQKLCAICAVIENPLIPVFYQRPSFNRYFGSPDQQLHTFELTEALKYYHAFNDLYNDESVEGLIFEYGEE